MESTFRGGQEEWGHSSEGGEPSKMDLSRVR